MAGPVLTSDLLTRATLARQLLLDRRPVPVKRAIARLAGVNAQAEDDARLSLLARIDGFTTGGVVRLIRRREVVRATAMRGTLQLLTADDYVTWRAALTPAIERRSGEPIEVDETILRRPLGPAEAGVESLVLRYLAAFGPATLKDLQYWSGLTGLRPAVEALVPRLRVLHDIVGREYFDVPRAPLPDDNTPLPPRLLPAFDNLLYAHDDRTRFAGDAPFDRRKGASTFLLRGKVAGTWAIEQDHLRLRPFDTIPRNERAPLRAEAERVLAFAAPDGNVEIGQP